MNSLLKSVPKENRQEEEKFKSHQDDIAETTGCLPSSSILP